MFAQTTTQKKKLCLGKIFKAPLSFCLQSFSCHASDAMQGRRWEPDRQVTKAKMANNFRASWRSFGPSFLQGIRHFRGITARKWKAHMRYTTCRYMSSIVDRKFSSLQHRNKHRLLCEQILAIELLWQKNSQLFSFTITIVYFNRVLNSYYQKRHGHRDGYSNEYEICKLSCFNSKTFKKNLA